MSKLVFEIIRCSLAEKTPKFHMCKSNVCFWDMITCSDMSPHGAHVIPWDFSCDSMGFTWEVTWDSHKGLP